MEHEETVSNFCLSRKTAEC